MELRLQRVIDYIDQHISDDLNLDHLAAISHLSRYHFSRIFALGVGVPLTKYIRQKRLAWAEELLLTTDLPINAISEKVGFLSLSSFHEAFREKNQCTPTSFRKTRKNLEEDRTKAQHENAVKTDNPSMTAFIQRIIAMNLSEVTLEDMDVAYRRQVGSYLDTGKLWQELLGWAIPRQLFPPQHQFFGISYDQPLVDDDKKTYDACVILPTGFDQSDQSIDYRTVKGGKFLLYHFYDSVERFALVYKEVVSEYLTISSYDLDERDFLEFVMNDPRQDPTGKVKIDFYIPVNERAK